VRVNISRYADESFPGWVECTLVDAYGYDHVFVEKVPVVTKAHLDSASSYPLIDADSPDGDGVWEDDS
jgi:hypothetical protein